MSGTLWIGKPRDDGIFWRNDDIWIVQGDDPSGPPGMAKTGVPSYIWATVTNTDPVRPAIGAIVEFYIHHFSPTPTGQTVELIGTSQIDLPPGQTDDVLCVVPFIPHQSGHGCLIVAIRHWLDVLPSNWLPSLGHWTYLSQIGQRNINVLEGSQGARMISSLVVSRTFGDSDAVTLKIKHYPVSETNISRFCKRIGISGNSDQLNGIGRIGLSLTHSIENEWWKTSELKLPISIGERRFVYFISDILPGPPGFEIVDIEAQIDGKVVGGVGHVFVRK